MKAIRLAVAILAFASIARAEPSALPGEIPSYKKSVDPTAPFVFSPVDGQFHANSSTYPLYCATPSGGSGGTVTQGSAGTQPWVVVPEWNADTMKATTRSTIANSQANSALTTGCTGSCVRCQVCNIGTINPICVKTVSGSTGPILYARAAATSPPMCYAFRTVTNIYADSSSSGCTGGSDVEITCEDD